MPCKISQIEFYLPAKVMDNEYLQSQFGIDRDFLEDKIGIKERRIAGDNEPTSEMAYQASSKLLAADPALREAIGLLIICTQTPDYRLPTTACILQHRLGLSTQCLAFDLNLGCSGFVYCLAVAGACLGSGLARKALLVMADQYSRLIDRTDKNTVSLFGDAASAAVVEISDDGSGVVDQDFGTDGSGAGSLIAYNSGVVRQADKSSCLYMNGREIFKFSITVVPATVGRVLERNGLAVGDIRFYVFHQANKYLLKEIQKIMGIRDDQLIIDLEYTGNTVSSTIPIALGNLIKSGSLRKGDRIILCGFGVGLSWGTMLYVY
jgi:3-oxoacyl-[acyl-carrier-protein] synthase-3